MVVHGFRYNQPQLLKVEAQKWPKLLQIVSKFKQLRLKLMAQQATLLVEEYSIDRVNSGSCGKEKTFEN